MNLVQFQSLARRATSILGALLAAHQDASLLTRLSDAQGITDALGTFEFPDGAGGIITDPDQPVPALDGLTVNQALAAITALQQFTAFMEAPAELEVAGGDVLNVTLQITHL